MQSMTGYGKAVVNNENFSVSVEIKGVNSRFLDISVRLPKELTFMEILIREFFKHKIKRGKISVYVNVEQNPQAENSLLIDWQSAEQKFQLLKKMNDHFQLNDQIRLNHLLMFPELFALDLQALAEEQIKPLLMQALQKASDEFVQMREQEGAHLLKDFQQRLSVIEKIVQEVKILAPKNIKSEFERLYKNVTTLMEEQKVDLNRLEQEIAIISDRVDITEECVRLLSHIKLFRQALQRSEEIGKRLNFILQEMHREANTISSKTTMLEISHKIITLKEEIEKMREQVQNVE